jgi:hypothetical protein
MLRPVAGLLAGAPLLVAFMPADRPPAVSATATRCWIEEDVAGALGALEAESSSRERDLNRAVVRLYAGEAARAEAELVSLRGREPRWASAVRWLARAQRELDRPETLETAEALLAMRDASARDALWAGDLALERGQLERARTWFLEAVREEDSLDLAWLGLQKVETRLGHEVAARGAGERAGALGARETSDVDPLDPPVKTLLPLLPTGAESLHYRVKYLFFKLATLSLETEKTVLHEGAPARRVVLTAKSSSFLFHIDSRFETVIDEGGRVLAHRHLANDSDAGEGAAAYDMDRERGRCRVRWVRDGQLAYDILPLPPGGQDGTSVLLLARALARGGASMLVPTAVDQTWKTTRLLTLGPDPIRWGGQDVPTVRIRSVGRYRGPGGLSGAVDMWISADERAVPYKVKMKVAVGSVELKLVPDRRDEDSDESDGDSVS